MNFFLKKQVSVWIVVFLLLINFAAILTIVYHVYFSDNREPSDNLSPDPGNIITEELSLNQAQRQQYQDLRMDFNQQSGPVVEQMTEIRLNIYKELSEAEPDKLKLDSLASSIGKLHASLKRITIDHLLKVKGICDSAQQDQLKKLIQEMMQSEGPFKGIGKKFQHRRGKGEVGGRQNKN
jgi:hypothetical protein